MEELLKTVVMLGGFGGMCFIIGASVGYSLGKDKVRNIYCQTMTLINNGGEINNTKEG